MNLAAVAGALIGLAFVVPAALVGLDRWLRARVERRRIATCLRAELGRTMTTRWVGR